MGKPHGPFPARGPRTFPKTTAEREKAFGKHNFATYDTINSKEGTLHISSVKGAETLKFRSGDWGKRVHVMRYEKGIVIVDEEKNVLRFIPRKV